MDFSSITGALSGFMNSAESSLSNIGKSMGFGEGGAVQKWGNRIGSGMGAVAKAVTDPTSLTDEDKAAFQGALHSATGDKTTLTAGITGKSQKDYLAPNTAGGTAAKAVDTEAQAKAAPAANGQVVGGNTSTGQQAATKAKELTMMQKIQLAGKALQGIQDANKKRTPPPPQVQAQARTGWARLNTDQLNNPLAARDAKSIYLQPTYQTKVRGY